MRLRSVASREGRGLIRCVRIVEKGAVREKFRRSKGVSRKVLRRCDERHSDVGAVGLMCGGRRRSRVGTTCA